MQILYCNEDREKRSGQAPQVKLSLLHNNFFNVHALHNKKNQHILIYPLKAVYIENEEANVGHWSATAVIEG
jgi:hypothetical protein